MAASDGHGNGVEAAALRRRAVPGNVVGRPVPTMPPLAADTSHGPWNPGIQSQIPSSLLGLATLYRPEHGRVALGEIREVADLTGLPLRQIAAFRPERLALHELLVRVTANVSVPDGTRIEDLGINFRRITSTLLASDIAPALPRIEAAYAQVRERIAAIVEREVRHLYRDDASAHAATPSPGWWDRLRGASPAREPEAAPEPSAVIAHWEARARASDRLERCALRALARVAGALLVKHERMWGDRTLVARVAVDLAANEAGSAAIGEIVEPLVRAGAAREGYQLLAAQDLPVVMNTKGPSAAGKSTMRPLQKALAERIGVDWSQFALISPDIWRKQLLDYGSLGADYKYAGAFTGDELAIIDQKLDRYMAGKASRGDVSHLLIDRFRFDSFAPDSEEAGSNLLTRFGQYVYLFFLVTPPEALVERAWNRGLDVGRYKAVDDTLAHAVEAYAGMPALFFTWIRRRDKRVHVEFLDNSVPRGEPPRTAAYGWNDVLNVLDVACLVSIERYRKVDIDALAPSRLYRTGENLCADANAAFVRRCLAEFPRVHFADQATGRVQACMHAGKAAWVDPIALELLSPALRSTLMAVQPGIDSCTRRPDAPEFLPAEDRVHTVGTWRTG